MKEISEEYFGSRGFVNTGTLCGIVLKELDLGVHLGCFFCGVAFVCLEGQKPNGYLKHIDSAMVRLRNSDLRVRDVKG